MIPTTEPAIRLGALMHRRDNTPWAKKEILLYKELVKAGMFNDLTDLTLLERYYLSERSKGKEGIYRRDLFTLLNNYRGELDRARQWFSEKNRRPQKPKTVQSTREVLIDVPVDDTEFERVRDVARKQMEELRAKLNPSLKT